MYTINIPAESTLAKKARAIAATYQLPAEVLVETLLMTVVRLSMESTPAGEEVPA